MRASTGEPKKIILSWDASSAQDFAYYKIYRTSSKFLPYSYLVKTQNTSYEDLINSNGKEYLYKVTVVDKDELESARQSEPVVGSTLTAPSAPSSVAASFEGSGVNLSWTSVERANSYTIIRDGGAGEHTISNIAGTSYTDTSVQTGVTYNYYVIAVDQFGIGSDRSSKAQVQIK